MNELIFTNQQVNEYSINPKGENSDKIQKTILSIRSTKFSHPYREFEIEKLNTFIEAKMNDQTLCIGFWNL